MLVAALAGAAFGLLHGLLTVGLALSQHVAGLGITLFATSLSYYAYRVSFPKVSTPPTIKPFGEITGSTASRRSRCSSAQTPLTLLALVLVPLIALGAVPHAGGPGGAHGRREPGRCRRAGH